MNLDFSNEMLSTRDVKLSTRDIFKGIPKFIRHEYRLLKRDVSDTDVELLHELYLQEYLILTKNVLDTNILFPQEMNSTPLPGF